MAHWKLLLGCALALAMSAPGRAGVTALPPGATLVDDRDAAPDAARVAQDVASVLAAVARGDADEAYRRLLLLADPWRFEAAASAAIERLQQAPPAPAAEALLERLSREPVRLYRRHDETAGDWFVPVFDVPGRAASARALLARVAARDRLLPALRAGGIEALSNAPDSAVMAAAIEALTPAEAQRLSQATLAKAAMAPGAAWSLLARRAPTPAALAAALEHSPEVEFLPLLQELPDRIDTGQALQWLEQAAMRPAYRATVASALGRLAPRSPAAQAKLIGLLGDEQAGPSAAAALAQLDVPDRLARIDAALSEAKDAKVVARLALALRLEGSPAALQRLARLQHDPRLPAVTRKELQR